MCTVSFIPVQGRYLLTSNRDEQVTRTPAISPQWYTLNGSRILFPKDGKADGSWMAVHENGNAAVLLNGAFEAHIPHPPYRKSRGQVLLEIIASIDPFTTINKYFLDQIEPFTLILLQANRLMECRWNGVHLFKKELAVDQPQIWASATLYDTATIAKRKTWFANFLHENPAPDQASVLRFHRFAGDGDAANDLCMNRQQQLMTVSITSISVSPKGGTMIYEDLLQNNRSITPFLHRSEKSIQ